MRIALASIDMAWMEKASNFLICSAYIQKASDYNADLVLFPEMTLTGFAVSSDVSESTEDSWTINAFKKIALDCRISIGFGVSISKGDGLVTNNFIIVNSLGELAAIYEKIHLFSLAGEDKYFKAGEKISTIDFFGGLTLGLTICYDLRFPELYVSLARHSNVIINIASWPEDRIGHWNTLLTARAIENQVVMIGVNRVGLDGNGLAYAKTSMVVNPNGSIRSPIFSDELLDVYEINHKEIDMQRNAFPMRRDRRPILYREICR